MLYNVSNFQLLKQQNSKKIFMTDGAHILHLILLPPKTGTINYLVECSLKYDISNNNDIKHNSIKLYILKGELLYL